MEINLNILKSIIIDEIGSVDRLNILDAQGPSVHNIIMITFISYTNGQVNKNGHYSNRQKVKYITTSDYISKEREIKLNELLNESI